MSIDGEYYSGILREMAEHAADERDAERMVTAAAFIDKAVGNYDAVCARVEEMTKATAFAKDYVDRAISSYIGDPANNDFQQGFKSALEVVRDEAFTPSPRPPTRVDRAFPEDSDYFCPGGYYIGSFVCKSCECPKGEMVTSQTCGGARE